MTAHPDLTPEQQASVTDEELAVIEQGHGPTGVIVNTGAPTICRRDSHLWPCPTARLIAALRACRELRGVAVEAMRLCMKDLQEHGVIFAPGDPPYDVLVAYDEEAG